MKKVMFTDFPKFKDKTPETVLVTLLLSDQRGLSSVVTTVGPERNDGQWTRSTRECQGNVVDRGNECDQTNDGERTERVKGWKT